MLNADMDLLGHNSSIDLFVDNHSNGSSGDVPDNSGLSMVKLVRHSLVDSTVSDDVDVISHAVCGEVSA